jgi:L,D-peptidoglycan transpeptidase YkuD (ErfK/YbiS/YcfS/YnhG family)
MTRYQAIVSVAARVAAVTCVAAASALTAQAQAGPDAPQLAWADARQVVLVTIPGWDSQQGSLRTFQRTAGGWESKSTAVPVVIGRAGAAWGVGLHPLQPGPVKKEGDGRSPAGVFSLGVAFGYAESADTNLPYIPLGMHDWCIDVPDSPLYNQLVDVRDVGAGAIEGSTEPMRRDLHVDGDQRYKLGFVIEHNPRNDQGAGSCIFAHLWQDPDAPTAGCTAMSEPHMQEILAWLQFDAKPVFVLLPQQEYERLRIPWDLPTTAE